MSVVGCPLSVVGYRLPSTTWVRRPRPLRRRTLSPTGFSAAMNAHPAPSSFSAVPAIPPEPARAGMFSTAIAACETTQTDAICVGRVAATMSLLAESVFPFSVRWRHGDRAAGASLSRCHRALRRRRTHQFHHRICTTRCDRVLAYPLRRYHPPPPPAHREGGVLSSLV